MEISIGVSLLLEALISGEPFVWRTMSKAILYGKQTSKNVDELLQRIAEHSRDLGAQTQQMMRNLDTCNDEELEELCHKVRNDHVWACLVLKDFESCDLSLQAVFARLGAVNSLKVRSLCRSKARRSGTSSCQSQVPDVVGLSRNFEYLVA